MKLVLALCAAAGLAGCASFDGHNLQAGASTLADVERVMGGAADKRQMGSETWYYYPRQPFGRKTFVARIAPDGKLAAIEQRLTDENVTRIVPNTTHGEQVRDLFGPPYTAMQFPRMDRSVWTWHMRRFGDPGIPVSLNVQMSPDGVVREVYIIDESESDFRPGGLSLGIGFGR